MECLLVSSEVREDLLKQLLRELDVHTEDMNFGFSLCQASRRRLYLYPSGVVGRASKKRLV